MALDYRKELFRYRHYYQRIEPFFQKPENIAYTMLILSFFTISFFGVFAIRPTITTITALRREIEDSKNINEQFDKKIAALISAQESYQRVQPKLPALYKKLPQATEFTTLLRDLESLTAIYNASISALQFHALPLDPSIEKDSETPVVNLNKEAQPFTFTLSIVADYPQIIVFIKQLNEISRLITITQIDIVSTGENQLQLTLECTSFYLPTKK